MTDPFAPSSHNPFDRGYYGPEELRTFGFAAVGEDVRISKTCTIIGLPNITIGSHVRIDDKVTIIAASGRVSIGSYIHVGESCYLSAAGGITLSDFCGLSQGVRVYSVTDDYGGDATLHVTTDACVDCGGQHSEGCHCGRHQDRAQTFGGALHDGLVQFQARFAHAVQVGHHDDAVLYRHSEQGDEAHAAGHIQRLAGQMQ